MYILTHMHACVCSHTECSPANGAHCHFCGWSTNQAAEDVCQEVQGLLQVGCQGCSLESSDYTTLHLVHYKYVRLMALICRTTTNTVMCFCPHCGNKTLAKVSVTVGEDGTLRYHFLSEKQFSHRGLRVMAFGWEGVTRGRGRGSLRTWIGAGQTIMSHSMVQRTRTHLISYRHSYLHPITITSGCPAKR